MSQLSIGHRAPDFELADMNGFSCRLADVLDRGPVALVFSKSSCPTCEFTLPYIQTIFSGADRLGCTLWGISQDDAGETREFAERFGITFRLLIEEHPFPVSAAYGLEFVPAYFLIQPDGTIAVSEAGFSKAGLNQFAGFEFFTAADGVPSWRPGCRSKN